MRYKAVNQMPLRIAENFIDQYIRHIPAQELPPKKMFTYHQGVFLSGVEHVYLQNGNKAYDEYIKDYLSVVLDEKKKAKQIKDHFWVSLNSLDFRQAGILLVRLYTESGNQQYLDSIAELCESLIDYPRNAHGGFWHMKSQPNQMWLDSLYMVGPLCAQYAVISKKNDFGNIAVEQACLMYDNMHDKSNNLLHHGWDDSFKAQWADKLTGLSSEKWGRAMGWFVVAVMDIIEILGKNFEGIPSLIEKVLSVFRSLPDYQTKNGYWCQVIDKPTYPGNWEETSCTCLIAYAIAKAVRIGILEQTYLKVAQKAYQAVVNSLVYREDGEILLGGICIGTCIDEGTYEHYISRKTCINDLHGVGAFLLMCAEMNLCKW